MKLVDNWKQVLLHSWAIRLTLLAGVFSGLEVVVQVFVNDPPIPRGVFASLALLVTVGATGARVVLQKVLHVDG